MKDNLIKFVIKLTAEQRALLQKRANHHTDGNVSEWLRLAGLKFKPKRSQDVDRKSQSESS